MIETDEVVLARLRRVISAQCGAGHGGVVDPALAVLPLVRELQREAQVDALTRAEELALNGDDALIASEIRILRERLAASHL